VAYRDELEALRLRLEIAEAENASLKAQLRSGGPITARANDPDWFSVRGGEPTTVTLRNESASKIGVFWLSYDGRERTIGTLVPKGVIEVETYIGFCWRFIDALSGEILAHERVVEARETIVYAGPDA